MLLFIEQKYRQFISQLLMVNYLLRIEFIEHLAVNKSKRLHSIVVGGFKRRLVSLVIFNGWGKKSMIETW